MTAAAALVLALSASSPATATFAGRNGVILVNEYGSGPPVAADAASPLARPADCNGPSSLWTMQTDGSHPKRVELGDAGLFSPSGRQLASDYYGDPCYPLFNGGNTDPSAGPYLSSADGRHRRRIAGDGIVGWLASGRLIVSQNTAVGVRLLDPLGGGVLMSVPDPNPHGYSPPGEAEGFAMSCSGRVAISRLTGFAGELDVLTRTVIGVGAGRHGQVNTQRIAFARHGLAVSAWSPDGRSLLFERRASPGFYAPVSLWIAGAHGRGVHQLSHPGDAVDSGAMWSPDGRRILFEREQYDAGGIVTQQVVVINRDGSNPHVITDMVEFVQPFPVVWAPDSKSIAFIQTYSNHLQIADATTGALTEDIPFKGFNVEDWQALPGQAPVRCADRVATPSRIAPAAPSDPETERARSE